MHAYTVVQPFVGKRSMRMEKFEELRAARSCVCTNSGTEIVRMVLGAI